ncbi:major facilitator superfamily domain-containing protein [Aspergillus karnatakaensis]|uniref:major facilitator superfamily domain-containing protein n=1 Tax=Aspergillus karnatakaensis TaxID=1810916 RepID=UPI003CCDFD40
MSTAVDAEKSRLSDEKRRGSQDPADVLGMDETYTPEEEKALVRKIDRVILPIMCIVFLLQYLDKQSLSYAGVFGLIEDLGLSNSQYSWCSSIFYVGQLVSEYPFIYLMSRLPLAKFVGATVVLWGISCTCLAAPQNYAGFAAVRFLLGFTEGAVSPAFVTITSIWWRKHEHAYRTALWVSMNGIAQTLGCLIMYGIGKNDSLDLAPWRTLFLICGAITIASGVGFFTLMPNGPQDAWFLTPREKQVLSLRMQKDREGGDKTSFSMQQLRETMLDPKAWCVFWFGVLVTMQSPVLTFATLVINSIGYTQLETMLYTAPSGAVQVTLLWIGVLLCYLLPRQRTLVVVVLTIPPIVGNILMLILPLSSGWGLIASAWLASCISAAMSVLLSLVASNVKGNTKRAIVNAMFFIGYCAGCIASPQLWTNRPKYLEGLITALVTWGLLIVTTLVYRVLCLRDNKARERAEAAGSGLEGGVGGAMDLDVNGSPHTDVTDKQDRDFRYSV